MYGTFNPEIGQLYPEERTALHNAVLEHKPQLCLEIGTWKGAGSTLQIVAALAQNQMGHLHSCDPDPDMFNTASAFYASPQGEAFLPYLSLYNQKSSELIAEIKKSKAKLDFVFADGPEDPDIALNDFKAIEPLMNVGGLFVAHDWLHEGSIKVSKLKKHMLSVSNWTLVNLLAPPSSVGLAFFRKL